MGVLRCPTPPARKTSAPRSTADGPAGPLNGTQVRSYYDCENDLLLPNLVLDGGDHAISICNSLGAAAVVDRYRAGPTYLGRHIRNLVEGAGGSRRAKRSKGH